MTIFSRYRSNPFLAAAVILCLAVVSVIYVVDDAREYLADIASFLPTLTVSLLMIPPVIFFLWYFSSYGRIQRGILRIAWFGRTARVSTRNLSSVEVLRGRGKSLMLRLSDEFGSELVFPLNVWRDEALIVAGILRAASNRRIDVSGDPELLEEFFHCLNDHRTWDAQLAHSEPDLPLVKK